MLELFGDHPELHGAEPLGPQQGELPEAMELLPAEGTGQGLQGKLYSRFLDTRLINECLIIGKIALPPRFHK